MTLQTEDRQHFVTCNKEDLFQGYKKQKFLHESLECKRQEKLKTLENVKMKKESMYLFALAGKLFYLLKKERRMAVNTI